ncbi:hypothetical protein DVS77_26250 [Mycolicibacterium moriokaense]|nr:hypothetical protein DVS77_26250 [Mycolicibacterium moriokaense]
MNRNELQKLIADMTDDELEQLIDKLDHDELEQLHKRAAAPEDPARQFLHAILAERERDWMAEVTERLSAPSQPKTSRGNRVPREGGDPGKPRVTERQRLVDFVRTVTDPTHEPTL